MLQPAVFPHAVLLRIQSVHFPRSRVLHRSVVDAHNLRFVVSHFTAFALTLSFATLIDCNNLDHGCSPSRSSSQSASRTSQDSSQRSHLSCSLRPQSTTPASKESGKECQSSTHSSHGKPIPSSRCSCGNSQCPSPCSICRDHQRCSRCSPWGPQRPPLPCQLFGT